MRALAHHRARRHGVGATVAFVSIIFDAPDQMWM
jgi:hypothetical protein